jgi:hypothetical protein
VSPTRVAATFSVAACFVLLAAACGGSSGPSTNGSGSSRGEEALAFARCMRSHGVSNFPDPNAEGDFAPFDTDVSKSVSANANDACEHLLKHAGGDGGGTQGAQQKLAFALEVAQCMRRRGFPTYPDPSGSGIRFEGTGIDIRSPRFQSTEPACETSARKALGLP